MHHTPVKSSNIVSIGYDPAAKALQAKFTTGKTYEYAGVSQAEHAALMASESCGSCFSSTIRKNYTGKEVK